MREWVLRHLVPGRPRNIGRESNYLIGKGRYREALELCMANWPPVDDQGPSGRNLLAAAYVAQDADWVTRGLRAFQDDVRRRGPDQEGTIERDALAITEDECNDPLQSWRVHALAASILAGSYPAQIKALRRALELHPSPELYLRLAMMERMGPDQDRGRLEAERVLTDGMTAFPENVRIRQNLAVVLLELGRAGEAEKFADRIDDDEVEVPGEYKESAQAWFHCFRAEIKHALGKDREALGEFRRALELYPDYFQPEIKDMPIQQFLLYKKLRREFHLE